jgi:hypothetical protein
MNIVWLKVVQNALRLHGPNEDVVRQRLAHRDELIVKRREWQPIERTPSSSTKHEQSKRGIASTRHFEVELVKHKSQRFDKRVEDEFESRGEPGHLEFASTRSERRCLEQLVLVLHGFAERQRYLHGASSASTTDTTERFTNERANKRVREELQRHHVDFK